MNFYIRSQRWGILLSGKMRVDRGTLFWATGAGYLGNNFLPFRSGEIIRAVALAEKAGLSKVFVLTTALTERVFDTAFLIILTLFLIPKVGQVPDWLPPAMRVLGALSFIALAALLFAPRLEGVFKWLIQRLPFPAGWRPKIAHILEQFLEGAGALRDPGRAGLFLLFTCGIWLLDGIGTMCSARAFSMELELHQSLLLLIGLGLSSAIPSAPGYIGVYQFVAVTVLAVFGHAQSQALAYILVAQAIGMLLTLIWGLVGLWRLGIHPNEIGR